MTDVSGVIRSATRFGLPGHKRGQEVVAVCTVSIDSREAGIGIKGPPSRAIRCLPDWRAGNFDQDVGAQIQAGGIAEGVNAAQGPRRESAVLSEFVEERHRMVLDRTTPRKMTPGLKLGIARTQDVPKKLSLGRQSFGEEAHQPAQDGHIEVIEYLRSPNEVEFEPVEMLDAKIYGMEEPGILLNEAMIGHLAVSLREIGGMNVHAKVSRVFEVLDHGDAALQGAAAEVEDAVMRLEAVHLQGRDLVMPQGVPMPQRANHGLPAMLGTQPRNKGAALEKDAFGGVKQHTSWFLASCGGFQAPRAGLTFSHPRFSSLRAASRPDLP